MFIYILIKSYFKFIYFSFQKFKSLLQQFLKFQQFYFFLFFIFKFIYFIFIFDCVGSLLLHTGFLQLQRVGATLSCGALAPYSVTSLVAGHWLQACRLQQLWHTGLVVVARGLQSAGSVVVAHGLSCSVACGIFPDQGSNPCPLHWQADS